MDGGDSQRERERRMAYKLLHIKWMKGFGFKGTSRVAGWLGIGARTIYSFILTAMVMQVQRVDR